MDQEAGFKVTTCHPNIFQQLLLDARALDGLTFTGDRRYIHTMAYKLPPSFFISMQVYGLDKAQVRSAKHSQQDVHGDCQDIEVDGACSY